MANWLVKILPPEAVRRLQGRNLPTNIRPGTPMARPGSPPAILPNASIVYGIAASALFIIALYFMFFRGAWITGFLVLLPAAGFLGFALHFIKHPH